MCLDEVGPTMKFSYANDTRGVNVSSMNKRVQNIHLQGDTLFKQLLYFKVAFDFILYVCVHEGFVIVSETKVKE